MNIPSFSSNLKTGAKGLDFSKYTTFGAPAAAILVSVVVLVLVVLPRFSQALSLRVTNAELTSRADALSKKASLLSGLDEAKLQDQIGLAEQAMPSDKSVFTAVRQIESAASQNGVILERVDVAPGNLSGEDPNAKAGTSQGSAATSTVAPKVDIKIATTSDYKSFLKFLSSVYALPRVLGVRDLTISAAGAAGTSLHADFVIEAYWKPLPTQLGSVESQIQNLTPKEEDLLKSIQTANSSTSSTASAIPNIPTGRSDLFTPF